MIFTSFEFIAFFLLVIGARGMVRSILAERWFLLLTSLFFCLTASISSAALILFITLVDFSIGGKGA